MKHITALIIGSIVFALLGTASVSAAGLGSIKVTSSAFKNGKTIPQKYGMPENVSIPLKWKVDKKLAKKIKSYAILMVDRHPKANEWAHMFALNIAPNVMSFKEGAATLCPDDVEAYFIGNADNPVDSSNTEEVQKIVTKVQELFARCSNKIKQGKKVLGDVNLNRFGFPGYGGPYPPEGSGKHEYEIIVYGLSKKQIQVSSSAIRNGTADLETMLESLAVAKGSLKGTYKISSLASAAPSASVDITAAGFSPNAVTIKEGEKVIFINKDSDIHWPASAVHPVHTDYPETGGCVGSTFDACTGLAKDEQFEFTFTHKGTWNYHDHLNSSLQGTITVE